MNPRLVRENAQTGEITASLVWDGPSDLDLHAGVELKTGLREHISFSNKCGTGGQLDVDANASNTIQDPVENIFWDRPPAGTFWVWVHNCQKRDADAKVPFRLALRLPGRELDFEGDCDNNERVPCFKFNVDGEGKVEVCDDAEMPPADVVSAPAPAVPDSHVRARRVQLDDDTWAVGLKLSPDHPALKTRTSTRFHFVLDNSGSMGRQTEEARKCFSKLVSVANGPCSLTVFSHETTTLGEAFVSPAEMLAPPLPSQGQTDISGGVKAALDVITRFETAKSGEEGDTHHVLVLLSDGQHNHGPHPRETLPAMGADLRREFPALRLSVVVVGVTGSSDTAIGMLLKQSLETVQIPALEPIYFASSMAQMTAVLGQMHDGLGCLRGGLLRVACPDGSWGIVDVVGEQPAKHVNFLASESETALLVKEVKPEALLVNRESVACADVADFDSDLAATALETLMERVRVRRVAGGAGAVRGALEQIEAWTAALEEKIKETRSREGGAHLARVEAALRALQGVRNQRAEIEALDAKSSAGQAAFLTRGRFGAQDSGTGPSGPAASKKVCRRPAAGKAAAKAAKVKAKAAEKAAKAKAKAKEKAAKAKAKAKAKAAKARPIKVAKGKRAKKLVLAGKARKTGGGLKKEHLMVSKKGKVVSKRMVAAAQGKFDQYLKPWADACRSAKESLGLSGFVAIRKGTPVYAKAREIFDARAK